MSDAYCVILTTVGSQDEANRLAELLVERKLAACVQIANIASVYRWQGQVQKEAEYLLLIKTATHLYQEVEATIVENHSYEIPEIVQLPIVNGLERYLGWIAENTP
jgi:periplasmic divalent cation tolerance protein